MSDYRILVTGSRDWDRPAVIYDALAVPAAPHPASRLVVVHGMCDPRDPETGLAVRWATALRLPLPGQGQLLGADWLADVIARFLGFETEPHPADWQQHGRSAGFRRNELMVSLGADECLAFPGPCIAPRCEGRAPHMSHGTAHCAGLAERAGIPVRRITSD